MEPSNLHKQANFDASDPMSIYEFSQHLIGRSLRSLLEASDAPKEYKGKGAVGQMVEELFFGYGINSNREADFHSAGVELKCTPLKKSANGEFKIKERLVCTMIDYNEIVNTEFERSHILDKCRLMLLLYYLFVSGRDKWDYEFLFRILWQLPSKDLIQIKKDYDTIADRVRRGEAHLLSEGDTIYLGACRKGAKGDSLQRQPFSKIGAKKRAFSLKPSYQRYVLSHVLESGGTSYTNYTPTKADEFQLVSENELAKDSFENIIKYRFSDYIGLDLVQACSRLGIQPYQSKSKYADVCALVASNGQSKRLDRAEEFKKSGITMKTIRLNASGRPAEAMSFHNIDYTEVFENDDWEESDLYELFTTRFLFVVLRPIAGATIAIPNLRTHTTAEEQAYAISDVFFWTMPTGDLDHAKLYWENIRNAVLNNNIRREAFWSINDRQKFHVRPKGTKENNTTTNPHGGECPKYCYWFNADYVKSILDSIHK